MATTKTARALVLCDVPGHGLKVGQVLEASPALLKTLEAGGSVDPAKAAVAYALEQGAAIVRAPGDVGSPAPDGAPSEASPT